MVLSKNQVKVMVWSGKVAQGRVTLDEGMAVRLSVEIWKDGGTEKTKETFNLKFNKQSLYSRHLGTN